MFDSNLGFLEAAEAEDISLQGLVLMAGSCGGNTDLFGSARTIQK